MKCANCQSENDPIELSCTQCGKSLARTKEDLERVDPRSTEAIGIAVGSMGLIGLFFVTLNMNALTLSGLDYVVPVLLLVVGTGIIAYARSLKK